MQVIKTLSASGLLVHSAQEKLIGQNHDLGGKHGDSQLLVQAPFSLGMPLCWLIGLDLLQIINKRIIVTQSKSISLKSHQWHSQNEAESSKSFLTFPWEVDCRVWFWFPSWFQVHMRRTPWLWHGWLLNKAIVNFSLPRGATSSYYYCDHHLIISMMDMAEPCCRVSWFSPSTTCTWHN